MWINMRLLWIGLLFSQWLEFFTVSSAEKRSFIKAKNHTLPGFTKEEGSCWRGPFAFIQGADTQFGFIESYVENKTDPGWTEEVRLTGKAVDAVNALRPRPRFFVVCGDLVDAMPGTRLRRAEERAFFRAFRRLHPDIALVCVCGNHDVGNRPTPASVRTHTRRFGDDRFAFYHGGVMFLVLNSQLYKAPDKVRRLARRQDKWLDERLAEAKSGAFKHVVVFQHIPWFIRSPDEKDFYFNIDTKTRKKMLEKFRQANVRVVFCGHWHGNGGGFYKDLEVVVTSAIGGQLRKDKSGLRVVKVLESSIHHRYYALEDVPKRISFDSRNESDLFDK